MAKSSFFQFPNTTELNRVEKLSKKVISYRGQSLWSVTKNAKRTIWL